MTVKKKLKRMLFNYYVRTGKIMTFQQVQDFFASKGFGHYTGKDGKKKLYIRKRIYGYYKFVKKSLPEMKRDRDFALELLEYTHKAVIEGRARQGCLRKVFSVVREKLTTDDEKYWGKIVYPLGKKKEERIEL